MSSLCEQGDLRLASRNAKDESSMDVADVAIGVMLLNVSEEKR